MINSISILISNIFKEKYEYDDLLIKIKENYNNNKDIISEYVKIFLNNNSELKTKIGKLFEKSSFQIIKIMKV